MAKHRIYTMVFAKVYTALVARAGAVGGAVIDVHDDDMALPGMRVEMPKGIEQSRAAQGVSPSGANMTDTLESR